MSAHVIKRGYVHVLETYRDDGQQIIFCSVCSCEGQGIPTCCPGKIVVSAQQVKIARKELDFIDGQWVMLKGNS